MEPILVYGYPAGSSMGLVAAFEWLAQPYKLCRVDMFGAMRDPSYGKINKRFETPTLITEDGKIITETLAIATWLVARDENRRISFDLKSSDSDRMYQLMGFVNSSLTTAFGPLWVALEMENSEPETVKILKKLGREQVMKRHNQLEELMENGSYLVGNQQSLADALLIGVARWLDFHEVDKRTTWPKIDRWRRRLEADPAVQFATALEEGKDVRGNGSLAGHLTLESVIKEYGIERKALPAS